MNNKVIFAAAGNGKTYDLCKQAIELSNSTKKEILIISYTNEGSKSIEKEYRKQNNGIINSNVIIKTWYSFVLSEFIKPYQCKLSLKNKHYKQEYAFKIPPNFIKSIDFYSGKKTESWNSSEHVQYFLNGAHDLYKDNVALLAVKCVKDSDGAVVKRLEDIYSYIFIDELQDYAGWDLEIFKFLFESKITITIVGDYRQATFRTNNSSKYKNYRDDKIRDFFKTLERSNLCEIRYSNVTRRFNQEICNFVNTIFDDKESNVVPNSEGISAENENRGVYIIENRFLSDYCNYYDPAVLRYDRKSKVKFEHSCKMYNYGNSKGCTFDRVVIIPVSTVIPFIQKQIEISSKQTKHKFYVACTRARHSIVFAIDNFESSNLFKKTEIRVGDRIIPALKYDSIL